MLWRFNDREIGRGVAEARSGPTQLFILLLVALFSTPTGLAWAQDETRLVILHTNDIHGQVLSRDGIGGMAELATLVRRTDADLILDGGDMFTGTMLADEYEGRPVIEIMNLLGYAAAALGNHEFDYGLDALEARVRDADFPILSANVHGVEGVRPYTIVEVEDLRIGVVGLTVENLAEVTHPKNLTTITVDPLIDTLEGFMPEVREQSDFVILVAHIDKDEQFRIARAFPEIRLIVAGHPHVARTDHFGPTTIVQTGSSTRNLGRIVMTVVDGEPKSITEELLVIENIPADPEVVELIRPYRDAIDDRASEVLGEATLPLVRSESTETPLGNLITDSIRSWAETDIAIAGFGGIRAPLGAGPITFGGVFEVLPFQNTVVKLTLTGAQLKSLLGRTALAISGIRAVWDSERSYPNLLIFVTLSDGTPIADELDYTVAVPDFLWAGGDGLVELTQGTDAQDTGMLVRNVLADYIRARGTIVPVLDGRVVIR